MNKTYIQLCQEAIVALKDRTGSSLAAIKKWILAHYPDLGGPHFNMRVNQALKNGLNKKIFEKVKSSFKISSSFKEAARAKKRKAVAAIAKKKRDSAAKALEMKAKKKQMAEEKKPISNAERERRSKEQAAKEAAAKRRAEAEAKAKAIAEIIKKRRYPIEDSRLHAEDKELGVKPPTEVTSRPYLPYFWQLTLPLSDKGRNGKTNSMVLSASKVEGLDFGSNGLIPDLLQVYHFFRGDVHFVISHESSPIVPEFTLQQLVFSTEQILNGNSRKTKLIPPLISHLFVCSLQILWQQSPISSDVDESEPITDSERQLRADLNKYLLPALTPVSWPDLCFLYMDAMERFFSSECSRDSSVLHPLPIDAEYLLGVTKEAIIPETPFAVKGSKSQNVQPDETDGHPLPEGYYGYLGDQRGTLYRAHHKLSRQDPWNLTAEELIAILRALTDDILATHPSAVSDIAAREEQMQDLLKAKKAADAHFRKMRLAFEGPKRPAKKNTVTSKDGETNRTNEVAEDEEKDEGERTFKPTISRKQFDNAKKQQEKANDAYEKGIRKLVARTEPIGYDRNYNAVYCFRHDPEILYVEDRKASSGSNVDLPQAIQFCRFSWHVIETTSLFDSYTASLDIRGKREYDLYEGLMGPVGSHQSLRRYLYDDVKEQQIVRAKIKEKEILKERLIAVKIKCDEELGRRSGRLASSAESELITIQKELDTLEKSLAEKVQVKERSFSELLGLDVLLKFEEGGKMETRRARDKKLSSKSRELPLLPCSKLCATGHIDGTGAVGMIVSDLLQLEEFCESLVPWEKGAPARKIWISRLEEAVSVWNVISADLLSLLDAERSQGTDGSPVNSQNGKSAEDGKRRKLDASAASLSVASVISLLKQPLLELEERVADVTNVAAATKDADLADDNMSLDESEDDQMNKQRLERLWKKCIHKLRETPTKNYFRIREHLVAAISAARKAHLPEIVSKLRAALLLYHPNAAGECKVASIKILEEYGDYDDEEDDVDEETPLEEKDELKEEPVPSVLCVEAVVLSSSLAGADVATRSDWISAVKSVKTLSRLAALAAAFTRNGTERLTKLEIERDALDSAISLWEKEEERNQKKIQAGKKPTASNTQDVGTSEVWANVIITNEFCMAKVEKYPWWPAKLCEAKDSSVAQSLEKLNRCIVALIGEMGSLRVVKKDDVVPFTGKRIDPDDAYQEQPKETKAQLDECLAIGRRILRGNAINSKRKNK